MQIKHLSITLTKEVQNSDKTLYQKKKNYPNMIQPYYQSIQGKIQRKKHDFPLFSAHSRIKLLQNLDEFLAQ